MAEQPIQHLSLAERTADAIMREILHGDIVEAGTLPSSRELAKRYGVSVIVIREALARLHARGALDRRQGRRTSLARPDHSAISSVLLLSTHGGSVSVEQLQDCREGLEAKAVELAAHSPRGDKRALLEPPLEGMRRARTIKTFNDNDLAFHMTLAELSDNRPIQLILAALREVVRETLDVTYGRVKAREGMHGISVALQLHERIGAAVIRGDADAAVNAIGAHFRHNVTPAASNGRKRAGTRPAVRVTRAR